MKEKVFITTDDIFADLGLENSAELKVRSDLMSEVVTIIRKSGLSQREIAQILEISPPKVSALITGKINDFSNDTLVSYLTRLGCNVEIKVMPHQRRISKSMKRGMLRIKKASVKGRTRKRSSSLGIQ